MDGSAVATMVWSSTARNIGSMMEGNTARNVGRGNGADGPALWPPGLRPGEPCPEESGLEESSLEGRCPEEPWSEEPWPEEPWPEEPWPEAPSPFAFRSKFMRNRVSFRGRSVRHQYRQRRTRQDVPRRAPEYHLAQAALGIGALHQEIAAMRFGVIENGL